MSTPSSNIVERRNALLRASGLVLIVMLLTGFGVSRIPQASGYDRLYASKSIQAKLDSFDLLKNRRAELLAILEELDATYSEMVVQDSIWESTSTLLSKSTAIKQIASLQTSMVTTLDMGSAPDRLDTLSKNAFSDLLTARMGIWALRDQLTKCSSSAPIISIPSGGGGSSPGLELEVLKHKAADIAETIKGQIDDLEKVVIKSGIFVKNKESKEKVEKVVKELDKVVEKLHKFR